MMDLYIRTLYIIIVSLFNIINLVNYKNELILDGWSIHFWIYFFCLCKGALINFTIYKGDKEIFICDYLMWLISY
jgi:hypothetical protein